MTKERTNTSEYSLTPEGGYEAMITKVDRKEIKGGYIIYEWNFESLVNGKTFYFKVGMFASQMNEILKALGAVEVSKNEFEWDREEVVGKTLSFVLGHVADKKGTIREQLSDVKLLTPIVNNNPSGVTDPKNIAWND